MPQGQWYVQSAEYNGANLLNGEMTVRSGSSGPMQIVLSDDGAELEVSLPPHKGGRAATILLIPQRGGPKLAQSLGSITEGTLQRTNLAPGEYTVLAVENGENLEYANPDVLDAYLSRASHVTLSAGQTGKVELTPLGGEETAQ
jgi:hypothetical protein